MTTFPPLGTRPCEHPGEPYYSAGSWFCRHCDQTLGIETNEGDVR